MNTFERFYFGFAFLCLAFLLESLLPFQLF